METNEIIENAIKDDSPNVLNLIKSTYDKVRVKWETIGNKKNPLWISIERKNYLVIYVRDNDDNITYGYKQRSKNNDA